MRGVALLFMVGCGSPGLTFEDDIAPIVQRECTGCHAGSSADADLDLRDDPFGTLINRDSAQAEFPLIEAGDALDSYAWHKINGTQTLAEGSGSSMPLGRWLLPEEIDLIGDWIDAGAPE